MMRKLAALAMVAGVAFAAPVAHADLPALTIEMVREAAAANLPLTNQDIDTIQQRCPDVRVFGGGPHGMSTAEQTEVFAAAQAQRVIPSTIWLRRYDAALAKCLPSAPLTNQ